MLKPTICRTSLAKLFATFAFSIVAISPAAALDIQLSSTGNATADAAFEQAAQIWEAEFSDAVTVYINTGFSNLGGSTLAQAGSTTTVATYTNVAAALVGDAGSADDLTAVANLEPGTELDFLTNQRSDSSVINPSGDIYNSFMAITRANAKSLGLVGANVGDTTTDPDAQITFNSGFAFDFDPSDGITGGQIDFVGVALHEIGHALGFVSGVDDIDFVTGAGPDAPPEDLNGAIPGTPDISEFAVFSTLDLFRYTPTSLLESGQPVLGLTFGGTANFSIDGGATTLATFSTGAFNGDGRQASHWKDNLGLGLLDPTFAPGELGVISALDRQAFDVIGWDLITEATTPIPEPGSFALAGLAALFGIAIVRGCRLDRR